jgi:BirA family transcriptional regulator, biotin operon repressor / biotin---[acetyl-CoA-carboxylase] ligase
MGRCDLGPDLISYLVPGSWISGESIASSLGVSRAAVSKRIRYLRMKGYIIESSTKKGYRLSENLDLLDSKIISKSLDSRLIGRELRYFREVGSTNQTADQIASSCRDGTVVLAEMQTNGKGRLSRAWLSPPGGIYMSLILKPEIPLANVYRINMAVSLAITKAFFSLYGLQTRIKWPNDILIHERKICGILMEINAEVDRLKYAIVGIGINANIDAKSLPSDWNATSLSTELGHAVSRIELIQRLLHDIEEAYLHLGSRDIYLQWRERSATLGRNVRVTSLDGNLEGKAVDLSEDGTLKIMVPEGIKQVLAGDCIHLRA